MQVILTFPGLKFQLPHENPNGEFEICSFCCHLLNQANVGAISKHFENSFRLDELLIEPSRVSSFNALDNGNGHRLRNSRAVKEQNI